MGSFRFATNSPNGMRLGMTLAEFDERLRALGATDLRPYKPKGVLTFRLSSNADMQQQQFAAIWDFLKSIHPDFCLYSYKNAREIYK